MTVEARPAHRSAFPSAPSTDEMKRLAAPIVALGLLTQIGCGPSEEVRSYTVPKPNDPAAPEPSQGDYRILGAMFPADKPAWFFKLIGKADALAAHEAAFEKFLASVKFPN